MKHFILTRVLTGAAGLLGLSGCVQPTGDVAPAHRVLVEVQARNSSSDYTGSILVQKHSAQHVRTVYSKGVGTGISTFSHEERPAPAGTTFTAQVQFQPAVAQPGSTLTGSMQATIKVDGVVKSSVTISGLTAPNSAGQRTATITATL